MTMRFSPRPLLAMFAISTLGTACPADENPGTGESGGASSGAVTDTDPGTESNTSMVDTGSSDGASTGADPSCECVAGDGVFLEPGCALDEVCEPLVMGCNEAQPADCALEDLLVANAEVLECHRDALAARTMGALRWEVPFVPDPGAAGQRGWILILADGQALTWSESWGAGTYDWTDALVVALKDAAYFGACTEGDVSAEASFLCLYDAADSRVSVCVDEHSVPFG